VGATSSAAAGCAGANSDRHERLVRKLERFTDRIAAIEGQKQRTIDLYAVGALRRQLGAAGSPNKQPAAVGRGFGSEPAKDSRTAKASQQGHFASVPRWRSRSIIFMAGWVPTAGQDSED
jgi:hypothetical protein